MAGSLVSGALGLGGCLSLPLVFRERLALLCDLLDPS